MGVPQNGGFIIDNPIEMDQDWGCPIFKAICLSKSHDPPSS